MLGPFSVDMYLPAFPAIGSELGASPIALQQTLSAYLFAFAFMMLWHGALSDALGRRPIVLGALAIFARKMLQSFVQFTLSGIAAGTVAPFLAHSVGALALGMAGFTLAGFAL